jgi:hypothetical protein
VLEVLEAASFELTDAGVVAVAHASKDPTYWIDRLEEL